MPSWIAIEVDLCATVATVDQPSYREERDQLVHPRRLWGGSGTAEGCAALVHQHGVWRVTGVLVDTTNARWLVLALAVLVAIHATHDRHAHA